MRSSLGLFLLATVATACAISIDSAIPDTESLFDSRLLGQWELPSEPDHAKVTRRDQTGYLIEYTDSDGSYGRFQGQLGRLDGRLVLEVWPDDVPVELADGHTSLLLPARLLFAIRFSENTAALTALDKDQLREALESGAVQMPYLIRQHKLILTGTTEQIQAGLRSFFESDGAFSDTATWVRTAVQ